MRSSRYEEEISDNNQLGINDRELHSMNKHIPGIRKSYTIQSAKFSNIAIAILDGSLLLPIQLSLLTLSSFVLVVWFLPCIVITLPTIAIAIVVALFQATTIAIAITISSVMINKNPQLDKIIEELQVKVPENHVTKCISECKIVQSFRKKPMIYHRTGEGYIPGRRDGDKNH